MLTSGGSVSGRFWRHILRPSWGGVRRADVFFADVCVGAVFAVPANGRHIWRPYGLVRVVRGLSPFVMLRRAHVRAQECRGAIYDARRAAGAKPSCVGCGGWMRASCGMSGAYA